MKILRIVKQMTGCHDICIFLDSDILNVNREGRWEEEAVRQQCAMWQVTCLPSPNGTDIRSEHYCSA